MSFPRGVVLLPRNSDKGLLTQTELYRLCPRLPPTLTLLLPSSSFIPAQVALSLLLTSPFLFTTRSTPFTRPPARRARQEQVLRSLSFCFLVFTPARKNLLALSPSPLPALALNEACFLSALDFLPCGPGELPSPWSERS